MTVIQPGLLILQGNRLELLMQAVFEWTGRHPLAPLEAEVFLVQSNGVAEWLKMALARHRGVCAAVRVELPARFLWRSYRQVLGAAAVPSRSATDKTALTWRLLQLLPLQLARPEFAPLSRFLDGGDWERRLQLAQRLADLFDQYQVYRADWLAAWAGGASGLPRPDGTGMEPLPPDQQWQPPLWRELVASIEPAALQATRPELHRRFVEVLAAGDARGPVPRRIVLFGLSSVPQQTLEALEALSGSSQILLAVANPCRYHWADIIEGRELLQATSRRHSHRAERDLAAVSLEEMHVHAHPLLAAWGRQGRDFVRQLDACDDTAGGHVPMPRIDLFDEDPGDTLLAQMQARIRDLVPLGEHDIAPRRSRDRSVVFHVAHGAQREVEILHDQLLALLADPPGVAIAPRDIVVMVPDIEVFAPAIRAVFGQYGRHDPRNIPFGIADLQQRAKNPLLVALEWLLRLPHQRCTSSELQSLLDVPAIAARFGVDADDLPQLGRWMAGAGIRWGLDAEQRAGLGLDACGEQNSWRFGLQRMLLGHASGGSGEGGAGDDYAGIEPYDEIGGLEAALVGSLAALIGAIERWTALAGTTAPPAVWGRRLDELLAAFFSPTDDGEQATIVALLEAMRDWLEAAEVAGFVESVPLSVVREAWLSAVDEPSLSQRFLGGGVTFCTLLPMRAVPFEVVCLLGMNDGDYPRSTWRSDFDLMSLPGQRRPGDRSRRDDDRYLMLEAVLSARQVLYVSWTGRSIRDNSPQPPSVLVSQLRDYLDAGWGREAVEAATTEHPLQPFSRRYFERAPGAPVTYAREWRQVHAGSDADAAPPPSPSLSGDFASGRTLLKVAHLARFLRNPAKAFFRHRLEVVFDELPDPIEDDEVFAVGGLDAWRLVDELVGRMPPDDADTSWLDRRGERLVRAGRLPMGGLGRREGDRLVAVATPMVQAWREQLARHDMTLGPRPLRLATPAGVLDDWLEGLRRSAATDGPDVHLALTASELLDAGKGSSAGRPRGRTLIDPWVRSLAASACGQPAEMVVVGRDAVVRLPPLPDEAARVAWDALIEAWQADMESPLPLACKTAIAFLQDPASARSVYDGTGVTEGERREACLARSYADFAALSADGRFAHWTSRLFGPLLTWLDGATVVPLERTASVADAELADG